MSEIIKYANSIFEQPWWLDIVAPNIWEEAIVKGSDGEIVARFPYIKVKNRLVMPPFTQNIGIWMRENIRYDYGVQKKIINEIFDQIGIIKECNISLNYRNEYVLPFRWIGMEISPNFTYRIDDLSDTNRLYSLFNKTAKKNIKYAKNKVSLRYEFNEYHFIETTKCTYSKQNRKIPFDIDMLCSIIRRAIVDGHGRYIEAVDEDDNVHACSFFLYDSEVCYYLYSASDGKYCKSGAQSLILWDAIQYAATVSKAFDFEGSMVEGIENFFRQFGGICVPYYSIKKLPLLKSIVDSQRIRIKKMIGYKI